MQEREGADHLHRISVNVNMAASWFLKSIAWLLSFAYTGNVKVKKIVSVNMKH